ncbi:LysR family transcriptional regulator [Paenibacillaceae bacterium]|nr:LysR family transcriptional regulator [Paenibacillaceae bacterium]
MELQQLKYFVEVANYLHFGRAAESLHASQQTVSHQIAQLEGELGVQLFKRTTRKVELTFAGEAMLEEVKLVFMHLQRGIDEATRAEGGRRGRLVIGYFGIMLYSILPGAVRLYRERYPEVEIVLQELASHQLEQKVQQGDIDIGFSVYLNDRHSELSMNWLTFSTESIVIALPKHHHLSGHKGLYLSDLAKESFVLLNRNDSPLLFDFFVLSCRQVGFSPNIVQTAASDQALIGLVAAGVGIAFVPSCMSKLFDSDITYVPMAESMLEIKLAICWLRNNETAQVENFAEIVRSFRLTP